MAVNHTCIIATEEDSPDTLDINEVQTSQSSPVAYIPPEPDKVKDEMTALLAPVLAQHDKIFNDMLEQLFKT